MSRTAQLTVAALVGVVAFSFGPVVSAVAGGISEQIRQGIAAYSGKHFATAEKQFGSALTRQPGSPTAALDLGTAEYRDGQYHKALSSFRRAATDRFASKHLQERAIYDQGKALAKLGGRARSPSEALGAYRKSVEAFRRALQIDPHSKNAAYNIEVVRRRIRRLEQKLPKHSTRRSSGKGGAGARKGPVPPSQNGQSKGTSRKPGVGTSGGKQSPGKGQNRSVGASPPTAHRAMTHRAKQGGGKPEKSNGLSSRSASSGTRKANGKGSRLAGSSKGSAGRAPASSAATAARQILNAENKHPRIMNIRSQQVSPYVSQNW